jgi:hypothetical protein
MEKPGSDGGPRPGRAVDAPPRRAFVVLPHSGYGEAVYALPD